MPKRRSKHVLVSGPTESPIFPAVRPAEPLPKADFERAESELRQKLLDVQAELRGADFPVFILVCGVDGAGKGELSNLLSKWMDPRGIATCAYDKPSQEERERPEYWRFWRDLPRRGSIGVFLSAWYHRPLLDKANDEIGERRFEAVLERIRAFERTHVDDGALILKLWMHLDRDQQQRRFETLEADPLQEWRVTSKDWRHWRMYDRFIAAAEHIVQSTATEKAPWLILDGPDEYRRVIEAGEHIVSRLREHLDARLARPKKGAREAAPPAEAPAPESGGSQLLAGLDLSLSLDKKTYQRELQEHQASLSRLHRRAKERGVSTVLVFEGWDAGGKGGAIRRLTAAMDARGYRVVSIAAPTDEELAHHYLWRFWSRLSRAGRVSIFDRSWYGRVLVERVEGLATPSEWERAYDEIREFEEQLTDHGIVVLKFWFQISHEEQERRFEARAKTPHKRWKLTEEDWRNRGKWDAYERAVDDMIRRTSTEDAPWILVEGNHKPFARIKVLREVCGRLRRALN
jgi:polyphosphate:AMP phosphotransferase